MLSSKIHEDVFIESVDITRPDYFTVKAVTSVVAKLYAKIDIDDDDTIVSMLIESAQIAFEKFTQKPLYQSDVVATFSANSGNLYFQVPLHPIVSIESVQQDGEDLTYTQKGDWIEIDSYNEAEGLITVTYTAGLYEEGDTVDSQIKEGILKYITSNFNDREDIYDGGIQEMPNGSKSKWKPFKHMRF